MLSHGTRRGGQTAWKKGLPWKGESYERLSNLLRSGLSRACRAVDKLRTTPHPAMPCTVYPFFWYPKNAGAWRGKNRKEKRYRFGSGGRHVNNSRKNWSRHKTHERKRPMTGVERGPGSR